MEKSEILDKIQKLFALATSSNEHEAKLATEMANKFLLKHNLSMQDVRERVNAKYVSETVNKEVLQRRPTEEKWVLFVIREFFFVRPIIKVLGHRSTTISFVGEKTNVEVASYVYHFLIRKYKDLWVEYKIKNNSPAIEKQSYYAGLTEGLKEQLSVMHKNVQTETGIVLVKDPEVEKAVEKYHGELSTRSHAKMHLNDEVMGHGIEDGKNIRISRGVEHHSGYGNLKLEKK